MILDVEVETVVLGLGAVLALASGRYIVTRMREASSHNADFWIFQRRFLLAFLTVMLADGLQGPYLYRLLHEYQLIQSQIAALYIASFMSAMIFGPTLGGFADKYGPRQLALVFCVMNLASCILLVSRSFFVLMFSRVINGISMSLLFSTFESWMIREHLQIGFDADWISRTMSLATFGNGVVAVFAALSANVLAERNGHHPLYPFVAASFVLIIAFWIIKFTWTEANQKIAPERTCAGSLKPLVTNSAIWKLGLVQAFFESAIFGIGFLWTPALDTRSGEHVPLGFIFAAFMMAIMTGSFGFRRLVEMGFAITTIMGYGLAVSVVSLALGTLRNDFHTLFLCLVGFQLGCGVYFPAVGTLRSRLLPDAHRTALMSWFRVPLNLIVITLLASASSYSTQFMIGSCALLAVAALVINKSLVQSIVAQERAAAVQAGTV